MTWTETPQISEPCWALIRFIGSIRVREIQVNEIKVRDFRVIRQTRVRARARRKGLKYQFTVL